MYDWRIVLGMGAGAGSVALLLAVPSMLPPAIANEQPAKTLLSTAAELFPPPFDPNSLVKWEYTLEPGLDTTAVRQSTIRKIGYGATEFVHVLETPSGTYSTDALQSPHVEYPGILKHRTRDQIGLAFWHNGGWVSQPALGAGSFITITPFEGGHLVVTDDGMCVVRPNSVSC